MLKIGLSIVLILIGIYALYVLYNSTDEFEKNVKLWVNEDLKLSQKQDNL